MTDLPEGLTQQLVEWRRHLHRNPEVAFEEHDTARYIREQLERIGGFELSSPTPTSVLAVKKGAGSGPTVLLRADIDALPMEETNTFDYKSEREGAMHACGHDGHTAILLGVAHALSAAQTPGDVRLIFQHAEEKFPGGAQELVDGGLMEGVDYVVGLHLNSSLPAGLLAFRAGPMMASPDVFHIRLQGKGGHAAHPEQVVDPIAIGAQIVSNLQHIVARRISPFDPLVVSVTQFHAGSADNVIPDVAELAGTVRVYDPELREQAPRMLEQIVAGLCAAHGASYELQYEQGYRAVINDADVTARLREAAESRFGKDAVGDAPQTMGGEDFSAYLQGTPGTFFNVGSGSDAADSRFPHHHPRFTLDESSLPRAVEMMLLAVQTLGGQEREQAAD